MTCSSTPRRSSRIASWLTRLLKVMLVFPAIDFLMMLLMIADDFVLTDTLLIVMTGAYIITMLGLFALFVAWVQELHVELGRIDPEYPITPNGALARVLIPLYNIYGIWDIFTTIGETLQESGNEEEARLGLFIRRRVGMLYVAWILLMLVQVLALITIAGSGYDTIALLGPFCSMLVYTFMIQITRAIDRGLRHAEMRTLVDDLTEPAFE